MNNFLSKIARAIFHGEAEKSAGDEGQRDTPAKPSATSALGRPATDSFKCPYCLSTNFVKRGLRQKKREQVQLYLCRDCAKTFTPHLTKGKHYPLAVMLDALSVYNLGYSLEETCRRVNNQKIPQSGTNLVNQTGSRNGWIDTLGIKLPQQKSFVKIQNNLGVDSPGIGPGRFGVSIQPSEPAEPAPELVSHVGLQPSTLSNWLAEFKDNLPYLRLREFALKRYQPKDMVATATLAHRQLYRYRFHRAKCDLMIQEDIQHRKFRPMYDFLDLVPSETPHQYFSEGERASEAPLTFSKTAMIVRGKTNFATKTAAFVLQSVKDRRLRHEAIQKFMLYNDSVTVATEVPVYIMRDDIEHMKTQLGFEMYEKKWEMRDGKLDNEMRNEKCDISLQNISLPNPASHISPLISIPKLITGHIDILQIRNGMVHILDYKPKAEKERPIEQLTLYAMALSRLTGLRLFEFKCAWFDEKDYFEFYPLHVLHKPGRARRRRKIATQEGIYLVNKNEKKVESVRPI